MNAEPVTELIGIELSMTAAEARDLYAELYRTAADQLMRPWPVDSKIADLMYQLRKMGADT